LEAGKQWLLSRASPGAPRRQAAFEARGTIASDRLTATTDASGAVPDASACGGGAPPAATMVAIVGRHEPQRVPAPEHRITSVMEQAPSWTALLISRSVTPTQRQTYMATHQEP
jgi:hypothetical protein